MAQRVAVRYFLGDCSRLVHTSLVNKVYCTRKGGLVQSMESERVGCLVFAGEEDVHGLQECFGRIIEETIDEY